MKQTLKMKTKKKIFRKGDIPLYFMALPTVVLLILFNYLPMGGVVLAFKNYNVRKGIWGSDWTGFSNFKYLFSTSDAFVITRNTVVYNVVFIILELILAVCVALLLNELRSKKGAKVFQTIYMLPYFLSWAVVAIVVTAFLERSNGFINYLNGIMGGSAKIDWYQKIEIWPVLLVFIHAWKNVGYSTVLYLATMAGISSDYYEAAMLDGATRFQQARYITIPQLRFIISISMIMAVGNVFRGDFGLFYTVTKDTGALYPVTNIIDTYIYRGLLNQSNLGMNTAAGLYQSVVGLVFILLANKVVTRIDTDSAMF